MPIITNGIRRVSVYNPADGVVVQMNNIIAEDETQFAIRQHAETDAQDPTGGNYFGGYRSEAVWKFIDSAGTLSQQLQTWFNAGTRVSMVAVGRSRNVQWYTTDRCEVVRDPILSRVEGRGDVWEARMVRVGGGDTDHDIHGNVNVIAHLAPVSGTSADREVVFPISGAVFAVSVDIVGSGNVGYRIEDFLGANIGSASNPRSDTRGNISRVITANTHFIAGTADAITSVSNMAIRLDGGTVYLDE